MCLCLSLCLSVSLSSLPSSLFLALSLSHPTLVSPSTTMHPDLRDTALGECENDRPDMFGEQQLHLCFAFENGGKSLEHFRFTSLYQAQVSATLCACFHHRFFTAKNALLLIRALGHAHTRTHTHTYAHTHAHARTRTHTHAPPHAAASAHPLTRRRAHVQ